MIAARLKPLVCLLPLLLWGCVVTPGKFVSTLDIRADRSFTFTYQGEVWAVDLGEQIGKGMGGGLSDDTEEASDEDEATLKPTKIAYRDKDEDDAATKAEKAAEDAAKTAELERKRRAIADSLRKEAGYRKVDYMGDGRFVIDYSISGKLTHNFIYPFNADAEVIFPFIAIELRGRDTIRMKANAFAAGSSSKGIPGPEGLGDKLDGVFTLTTDAEIVSQNTEDGATSGPRGKSITWKANPTTKDAPMAVLRVAPLAP